MSRIKKDDTEVLHVRLPVRIATLLRSFCAKEERTFGYVVTKALKKFFGVE